jgi:UDP-glucose 4-epimerase
MGRTKKELLKNLNKSSFRFMEWTVSWARFKKVKDAIPLLRPDGLNVSAIPINIDIEKPASSPLPLELLYDFIQRASHRVIVDFCPCRTAKECKNYPTNLGCLMMGQGAKEIDPSVGHRATKEEAFAHAEQAVKHGLIPFVGKSLTENLVFGVEDKNRFLVTCFCCECCCLSSFMRHIPAHLRNENMIKLDGVTLQVEDNCTGCGLCASSCFLQAIHIEGKHAVIGEGCIGCGRCSTLCPQKAIKISITNSRYIDQARRRIESLVDIH